MRIQTCFYVLAFVILYACSNRQGIPPDSGSTEVTIGYRNTGYCDSVNKGLCDDTLKGSPARSAFKAIGTSELTVEYNSPGVKGRIIWGGLVPYDRVWVAGAHGATRLSFNSKVIIGGKEVPAGTYAFFVIPSKDKWTLIINKNIYQHLADDYNANDDVVRVTAVPDTGAVVPRLTYDFGQANDQSAYLKLCWEQLCVQLPIQTDSRAVGQHVK